MNNLGIKVIGATNSLANFLSVPDEIYGSGLDGNVTIGTNTTLSRDMYYNNLTISDDVHLNTNGYRVFVRNMLIMSSSSGKKTTTSIGLKNGSSAIGSLGSGKIVAATNSLGGASASYTATAPTQTGYFDLARQAIQGFMFNASQTTPLALNGGAGNGTNPGGGVVIVSARKISGYGSIIADGYNNGSAYVTGGGVIILASQKLITSDIATNILGYANGTLKQFVV
jgi:hypothetical protein